jgi:hypothetical protein
MIRVQCPGCQIGLRLAPSAAGRNVTCPRCRSRLAAPALVEVPETPGAGGDDTPPPDGVGRLLLLGSLALLVLLTVAGLGGYLLSPTRSPAGPVAIGRPESPTGGGPKAAEQPAKTMEGKLTALLRGARDQAQAWHKDAVLVLIFVQLHLDGTLNETTLTFASESAGELAHITFAPGGEAKLVKMRAVLGGGNNPLGERYIDVPAGTPYRAGPAFANDKLPGQFTSVFGQGEFTAILADGRTVGFGLNRVDLGKLAPFKGYTLGRLAFSPDGKTLAVGRGDGSVKMWDVTQALKQ